jgi:hypothetical protein
VSQQRGKERLRFPTVTVHRAQGLVQWDPNGTLGAFVWCTWAIIFVMLFMMMVCYNLFPGQDADSYERHCRLLAHCCCCYQQVHAQSPLHAVQYLWRPGVYGAISPQACSFGLSFAIILSAQL